MNISGDIDLALKKYGEGKLTDAGSICRKILKKDPNNVDALHIFGVISHKNGDYNAAIKYIKKALRLDPHFAEAYHNLGNVLQDTGETDEAVYCYKKAVDIKPDLAQAYFHLGIIFQDKDLLEESIGYYRKAIDLNLHTFGIYNNLGLALQSEGQLESAIACYKKSLEIKPDFAEAHYNLGNALQDKGLIDKAIGCYQTAIQFKPDYADAHWNLALAFLLSGDFRQGWKEYEWRWKLKDHYQYHFEPPMWDGSDIRGRTVLLHAEQGFGDTIQFIRYASAVARKGARVVVQCQKELNRLLKCVSGVKEVLSSGEALPAFDMHCPLASLPLLFETTIDTIPSHTPYLFSDPEELRKWKDKIEDDTTTLKIGLVWSGNPKHKKDVHRSCPLVMFSPVAHLDNVTLYSLQKGEAANEAMSPPGGMKLINRAAEINDFTDTAGFIGALDLVISVDTSAAHLGGALGKPVWLLLPYHPDWRWLLKREDSPWYPTMRLFRQPKPGDWESVIKRVADELMALKPPGNRLHGS